MEKEPASAISVRRAGNVGAPATVCRERKRDRKLENKMIAIYLDLAR
jgi:hypothetical protein